MKEKEVNPVLFEKNKRLADQSDAFQHLEVLISERMTARCNLANQNPNISNSSVMQSKTSVLDQEMISDIHKKLKTGSAIGNNQHNLLQPLLDNTLIKQPSSDLQKGNISSPLKFQLNDPVFVNYMPYHIQNNIFPLHPNPFLQLFAQGSSVIPSSERSSEHKTHSQNLQAKGVPDLVSDFASINSNKNYQPGEFFNSKVQLSLPHIENVATTLKTTQNTPSRNRTANIRFLKDIPECEPITEIEPQKTIAESPYEIPDEEDSEGEDPDDEYEPEEIDVKETNTKKVRRQPQRQTSKVEPVEKQDELQIILSLNDEIVEILGYKEIDQSKVYALYLRSDKDVKKFFIKLRRNLSYYKKALRINPQ